jgi:hypothetical protein
MYLGTVVWVPLTAFLTAWAGLVFWLTTVIVNVTKGL